MPGQGFACPLFRHISASENMPMFPSEHGEISDITQPLMALPDWP